MDLISIIMPFYKKKPYFFNTLKSVLNQSYKNAEFFSKYGISLPVDPNLKKKEIIKICKLLNSV